MKEREKKEKEEKRENKGAHAINISRLLEKNRFRWGNNLKHVSLLCLCSQSISPSEVSRRKSANWPRLVPR